MRHLGSTIVIGCAGAAAALVAFTGGTAQTAAAPKARYWIDATTMSGLGMGTNPMAMLMGRGGGNRAQHSLWLRLGSTQAPAGGAPKADHFVPAGLRLGTSVPLDTPTGSPSEPGNYEFKRPKGRLRIFWGCGAHVGPGQPVVIDFAKVAAGQFPPNLFTINVPVERGPTPGNSRTYGTWPNPLDKSQKMLRGDSSLTGPHRIAGNYSPEISFTVAKDFLPALDVRSSAGADGTWNLMWQPVAGATGYYAMGIGGLDQSGGEAIDMVWWASSSSREFGGGLMDYLAPATVTRLIGQKVVMAPSQTACTVPAEVRAAAGQMFMTTMTAYGPEENFAFPPRPADPKVPWRPEWTAKVRYKAQGMAIAGLDMGAMMGNAGGEDEGNAPKKKCKKRGGFGGMLGGALGLPSDC